MATQKIITASPDYRELDAVFAEAGVDNFFLVCDGSLPFLKIDRYFRELTGRTGIRFTQFSDFQPNPLYESVVEGVRQYRLSGAKMIVVVGGGSAIDVAKCIKLYSNLDSSRCYLEQEIVPNDIPLVALPTTAGTGSEATRYAVIYYEGAKQSVTHQSIIPSVVVMDPSALETLPPYQKKATLLDALSHAVESFWSVNSTEESRGYSREAIRILMDGMDAYLAGDQSRNADMLKAANLAGKAINITQTTAGHAMCYKVTSLFGFAHGHAAALCVAALFPWMLEHTDRCIDPRGEEFLKDIFRQIADAMGVQTPGQAAGKFARVLACMEFRKAEPTEQDYRLLAGSVNPVRLKNHPVSLGDDILAIYRSALS